MSYYHLRSSLLRILRLDRLGEPEHFSSEVARITASIVRIIPINDWVRTEHGALSYREPCLGQVSLLEIFVEEDFVHVSISGVSGRKFQDASFMWFLEKHLVEP